MLEFKIAFPAGRHSGNPLNGNLDCHLITQSGAVYGVTFFTVENVHDLMNGVHSQAKYVWSSDMVIVPSLSDSALLDSVKSMFENEVVEHCGKYLGTVEEVYENRGPRDFLAHPLLARM